MNRKVRFLIISIILIAGIVLGINFVSNAAILDNAFGKELVNIEDNVGGIVAEFSHATSKSATEVLDDLNSMLEKENINASSGRTIEDEIIDKFYTIPGIFCVKHRQSLGSYNGTNNSQYMNSTHGGNYSMYYRVDFDEETPYRTDPELKNDPTAFLTVYEAHSSHSCGESDCNHTDQIVYSNFNAINIYSGPLHSIHTQANTYSNKHRIPYIISFQQNTWSLQYAPSEAQKALWGLTGGWSTSCDKGCGENCYTFQEMELHKAGIAVERYINNEKSHGANPSVSIPAGAEAGAAYFDRATQSDLDAAEELANQGLGGYENPQGHTVTASGMVRIGPFVMSDYAYAFSEDVAKYSNKDLEWKHVIAGIVDGYVTVTGEGDIPIVAKAEADQGDGALIVYKDWYNQVPYKYNSTSDVRGDASRGYKTTLNGNEHEILYKPMIDNSNGANAGVYTTRLSAKGSKELLSGGVITNTPLKVKVKDDAGNYTVEYPYPLPNSVFYIELPAHQCGDLPYSLLESITFTYRTTETTGNGDVIITRAAKSTTKFEKDASYTGDGVTTVTNPCSSYSCSDHTPSYASHSTSSTGGYKTCTYSWSCNTSGAPKDSSHDCTGHNYNDACACKHSCNNDCASKPSCPGGTNHVCDDGCVTEYCGHTHTSACCDGEHDCGRYCNCPGHSATHSSWFLCGHEHADCNRGSWHTDTSLDTVYGQPLLVVSDARTQVKENKVTSSLTVPILTKITTEFKPVFIWHGLDTGFSMDGSFNFITGTSGFFDFSDLSFTGVDDIGSLAEIGDRITYEATVTNHTGVNLYFWLYIVHPYKIVDDNVTNIKVSTNAVGDFFAGLGGTGGEFAGQVKPKNMVEEGARSTRTARLLIRAGSSYSFYYTYTLTKDVQTYVSDGVRRAHVPYIAISSRDWNKYKNGDKTDINVRKSNIDFVRKDWEGPQHEGPVITEINQITRPPEVKEYVVNINKYIYNVDHIYSNNKTDTSIQESVDRGYEFANGTTNLHTLEELKKLNEETEKNKKANPVYVEYGDRITYKIEVGNGKVSDRKPKNKYDVDKIYVTLVDELPKKYSGLTVKIEDENLQGAHLKKSIPARSSNNGGTITLTDLMIPKNGVTTIEVSFVIEEHERYDGSAAKLHENKAYIKPSIVYNYNRGPGANPGDGTPLEGLPLSEILDVCDVSALTTHVGSSSDWYVINDYQVDIDKYISSYKSDVHDSNELAHLTQEKPKIENKGLDKTGLTGLDGGTQASNEDLDRVDWTDAKKKNDPVQVERSDELIYSIKLENKAVTTGAGGYTNSQNSATQVRVSKIIEEIDPGLEIVDVRAFIYKKSGVKDREVTVTKNPNSWGATKYEFTLDHSTKTILDPGEFIVFYVKAIVNESNMSLRKLENTATIAVLTNINTPSNTNAASDPKVARIVKEEAANGYNENTEPQEVSTEVVRMKDLVISGKVWLDKDRDGKMETEDLTLLTAEEKARFNASGTMAGKAGVEVRLYKKGDTKPLRITFTDGNGEYTFSKKSDGGWYTNSFESSGNTSVSKDGKTYQRVDKAKKDAYGNYLNEYIDYYIEFVYDGVLYKSTELYSRPDYSEMSRADQGMTNLIGNGNYNGSYVYDSNAAEKDDVRANFNTKYEYISYNTALTGPNGTINPGGDLKFDDKTHTSLLKEDAKRAMTARTFINDQTNADNYLWLYKGDGVGGPNTEYLKYINLGLELREEVDISLTKDVYKVKTTINGESMEYDFNQNNTLNGATTGLGGSQRPVNEYLQDFIIKKPYGLELYEFDYKFRVDQYFSEEVRNYKGSESELNVEVTYRITIDNKPISDADDVKYGDGKGYVTETPLNVKVNEIMDLYEDNFIKLGEKTNNEIPVKIKDADGTLKDTQMKTIEAWYFKQDNAGTYIIENPTEVANGVKPLYKEDPTSSETKYAKVNLTIDAHSADSEFRNNGINYEDYGYNKLFIRGMGDIAIGENQSLDIYVKYVLDKGEEQFELSSASIDSYEETTKDGVTKYNSATLGDAYGSYTYTIERQGTTNKFTIQRSLKIKDPVTTNERTNNRGVENIAQINAYSVWYTDGSPASLVDRNSNVGNIGTDGSSPDDYTQYDDTAYKTGIVISVEDTAMDKDDGSEISKFGVLEITGTAPLERVITGTVWDDARSVEVSEKYSAGPGAPQQLTNKQYLGNGEYSDDATDVNNRKVASAIANQNVEINYKRDDGSSVTEDHDFPIRNVKAEFIEIVKMEDPDVPGEYRYYEQLLQQVTWHQTQWDRTDDNGYYKLEGLIPGTYIIRFTYGDNVNDDGTFDETSKAQQDMLIFNGHDYKSTQFNPELETIQGKNADKIMEILEGDGISDAIDDEVRRLEVNSYSEVMTNPKAEILKGLGNGASKNGKSITTRTDASTKEELEDLIENTTMQAETVEFLVKPEKLTTDQIDKRKESLVNMLNPDYLLYSKLEAVQALERNNREFTIAHIDFGLEYRPENEIRLVKEIEEVKLITEDGETLVDLYFYTDGKGTATTHKVDKNKSKGLELVQFVSNAYNVLLKDLTNEDKQGFVFVQVDEEILQGCTVQIVYKFEAENNSEIDRITVNLDEIRYKENPEAQKLINAYPTAKVVADKDYTASGIAAEVVKADMYKTDAKGVEYRNKQKMLLAKETANLPADQQWEKEKQAYYGRYVGYTYYTGDITKLDTVASLKFDKILDYVDVNIEYIQKSEQSNTEDKFWIRSKSKDLENHIYQLRKNLVELLENGRGYTYEENLVLSVDDRIKDDTYSTRYSSFKITGVDDNIRNNDLARFLLPKGTVLNESERDKSVATIRLNVSKVLSAEADKKDMSYENMAEIIQFTTLTGRRTDFGTTIGNADIEAIAKKGGDEGKGSLEFVTAALESDTAATETITLIPPTGLMRNRRAIVNVVQATSVGVGIVFILGTIAVILIMIITIILFVIRKYKKRRII